ncbi:MAG: glycerophosphodiester phosphodiesterase [Deltaproteobacteria bacterium]|nr:glycerophosphodiester phosphodiesterase [Deltaproteobacteria bacterium]
MRWSCSWCLVLILSAALSAPLLGSHAQARPEIHGHRGARARLPENTLAGFSYAIGAGADVLEMDLQVTRDDVLVVIHDAHVDVKRCVWANGKPLTRAMAVRKLTLATLQRLDCGRKGHPRFPHQKRLPRSGIPTLNQVLHATKARRSRRGQPIRYNIETKSVPSLSDLSPTPAHFATLVVKALRKHGLVTRAVLQSFDARTLRAAHDLAPRLRLALLTAENHVDYLTLAKAHGVSIISPHHQWLLRSDVQRLHAHKVAVMPWTVNKSADWARMLQLGVDGIITDDPAGLHTFMLKRLKVPHPTGQ